MKIRPFTSYGKEFGGSLRVGEPLAGGSLPGES
jgi:hypothetical protein